MTIDVRQYQSTGPGKFEAEPPHTQYYWEQVMDGDGETIASDIDGSSEFAQFADLFQADAEESEAFGLNIGDWVIVWEDSSGFAYSRVASTREAAEVQWRAWLGV